MVLDSTTGARIFFDAACAVRAGPRGRGASMRSSARIAALWAFTAAFSAAACGALAWAADIDQELLDRQMAGQTPAGPEQARFLLFSTTDLWRHGGFYPD